MKTTLSDKEINDAQMLVNDAMRDTSALTSEQEIRLAVACMVLANELVSVGRRVDNMLSEEEDGKL